MTFVGGCDDLLKWCIEGYIYMHLYTNNLYILIIYVIIFFYKGDDMTFVGGCDDLF
jgi:hypothetical protein